MDEKAIERYLSPLRLITHSCARLESTGGFVVYVDPYDMPTAPHDADAVLVTHDHFDHFSPEDIAKVAKASSELVVPVSLADQAADLGMRAVTTCAPGDSVELAASVVVEATRAYNIGKDFHPKANNWLGYVVTLDGVRYFHMGDTDQNPDNEQVGCDVLLIPVGGTYTMTAEEAVPCALSIRPRVAVPMHYGTVAGSPEDGARFAKLLREAQATGAASRLTDDACATGADDDCATPVESAVIMGRGV